MEQKNATLTGSDGPVHGIIKSITFEGVKAWEFKSIDDTLHLIIAADKDGNWYKVAGTEPYLFGWVDEMTEQIAKLH